MPIKFFTPLLVVVTIVFVTAILPACSRETISPGLFYSSYNEDSKENEAYVIKKNGDTVWGKKIDGVKSGFTTAYVELDKQKFDFREIKGYRDRQTFFITQGKQKVKRILHGPLLNIYMDNRMKTISDNPNGEFHNVIFAQKGENGQLVRFKNLKEFKKIIDDCPLAAKMADMSEKEFYKIIRTDNFYFYKIVAVYNAGCKK